MKAHPHPGHLTIGALALTLHTAFGGCCADLPDAEHFARATVVVDAEVRHLECRQTAAGTLETVATMRLAESFKGAPGETFELTYPGGRLGHRATWDSRTLALVEGERYFLHLAGSPEQGWTS
ncbi:MAG: hypothetical protein K9N23_23040, partial [Akkermansiaceae bacterium]|nr:hypothetical protein [Akkermansiaceae bacterium]